MSSGRGTAAARRVEIDGATWWPGDRAAPVFADVTLHIEAGQRVLLTGPNGCGKSVLLRAIQGQLPDPAQGEWRGEVRVIDPANPGAPTVTPSTPATTLPATCAPTDASDAMDVTAPDATAAAATETDATAADPADATDETAATMPADLVPDDAAGASTAVPKVSRKALKAAFLAVGLRQLDLNVSDERVSGGQGQLVRIARQVAAAPPLLVFDEPVSMLDPGSLATATTAIGAAAARSGSTLVVAAHRLTPWLAHVDRVIAMDASGRIIADCLPAQVTTRYAPSLLAAGIWVPGEPEPKPAPVGVAWDEPVVHRRSIVARAEAVTVRHSDAEALADEMPGMRREVIAIRDGDLDVLSGQCVALVGPSGAGGSSWLSALAGVVTTDDGTVSWSGAAMQVDNASRGGRPPRAAASRAAGSGSEPGMPSGGAPDTIAPHQLTSRDLVRALGWVPQDPSSTVLGATVREDLLTTALAAGLEPYLAAARADVLLDALGLRRLAGANPRLLSSGEARRLALAGAVIHQPALLLADQPTIEQDRYGWAAVTGIIESLRIAGSAVLLTTHDGGLTPYADRIVGVRPPRVSSAKSSHVRVPGTVDERATQADLVVLAAGAAAEPGPDRSAAGLGTARGGHQGATASADRTAAEWGAADPSVEPGRSPSAGPTTSVDSATGATAARTTSVDSATGATAARVPSAQADPAIDPLNWSDSPVSGTAPSPVSGPTGAGAAAAGALAIAPGRRTPGGVWWPVFMVAAVVFACAGLLHFFGGPELRDLAETVLWWAGVAMALTVTWGVLQASRRASRRDAGSAADGRTRDPQGGPGQPVPGRSLVEEPDGIPEMEAAGRDGAAIDRVRERNGIPESAVARTGAGTPDGAQDRARRLRGIGDQL